MSETNSETKQSPRRSRGMKRIAIGTLVVLAAGVGVTAWASGRDGGCGFRGGHGMGGSGMMWGDGGPGMAGGSGRMVDRMLDGLNATDAQRTQIRQITQAAMADGKAQFEAGRALREKGLALMSAPTIDTAAVEALRQQMLAQHEQMSKKMTETMIAVANVLTPEQRAKFAERMKMRGEERREHMQRRQGASGPKS